MAMSSMFCVDFWWSFCILDLKRCCRWLSSRYDMSKTAIIRKALRMYQVIDTRLQKGEKLFMEDEVEKKKSELLVL